MPNFHVFYWGLICHIGRAGQEDIKTHAALVKAPGHTPRIVFAANDDLELTTNVTFDTSGVATIDPEHHAFYIPHLRDILGGTIRPAIQDKSGADWALFADYPAGEGECAIDVVDRYDAVTRHRIKGSSAAGPQPPERLVGRIHRLTVALPEDVTTVNVHFNGTTRNVPATDAILIANSDTTRLADALTLLNGVIDVLEVKGVRDRGIEVVEGVRAAAELLSTEIADTENTNHFEYFSELLICGEKARAEERKVNLDDLAFPSEFQWVKDYVVTTRVCASTHSECGPTGYP